MVKPSCAVRWSMHEASPPHLQYPWWFPSYSCSLSTIPRCWSTNCRTSACNSTKFSSLESSIMAQARRTEGSNAMRCNELRIFLYSERLSGNMVSSSLAASEEQPRIGKLNLFACMFLCIWRPTSVWKTTEVAPIPRLNVCNHCRLEVTARPADLTVHVSIIKLRVHMYGYPKIMHTNMCVFVLVCQCLCKYIYIYTTKYLDISMPYNMYEQYLRVFVCVHMCACQCVSVSLHRCLAPPFSTPMATSRDLTNMRLFGHDTQSLVISHSSPIRIYYGWLIHSPLSKSLHKWPHFACQHDH